MDLPNGGAREETISMTDLSSPEKLIAAKLDGKTALKSNEKSEAGDAETPFHQTLDFLLDVPLKIAAVLGNTRMTIRQVLQLGQNSIIEIDKLAGEPLEVYVNSRFIARGEVVVSNEKFAIRLTDIISPNERVETVK